MPNIPGAPVGTINYEQPYVREKRTNQFDIKLTYQAAQNDNLSVRYSHQNAKTMDPGTFGVWGGVKDYSPERAPIRPTTWPSTTTAYGQRRWSRKSVSAGRPTITSRSPRPTG